MDSKLSEALKAIVPEDEKILGAFVGKRGPDINIGLIVMAIQLPIIIFILPRGYWWILIHSLAVGLGIVLWGYLAYDYVTVVRTDRNILRIENGRRKRPRPDAEIIYLGLDAIRLVGDKGFGPEKVGVGYQDLWPCGGDMHEPRRLAELPRTSN